jgi:hypothetical protein
MTETKSVTIKNSNSIEQEANHNSADFGKLVANHRAYFRSGATRSVE